MTDRATLDSAILQVMRAQVALEPLLAELCAAARHGNLDRIGNAAFDAQMAGDVLTGALSAVFSQAAELSVDALQARSARSVSANL